MTKEQKEGILITTVSTIALLILALYTNWGGGFSDANFYFNGFERSCTTKYIPPPSGSFLLGTICPDGIERVYYFSIDFRTILIFFLPIISYGMLRAFGIVKRLFKFEENLFKFIDE